MSETGNEQPDRCRLECTDQGFRLTQELAKTVGKVYNFRGPVKVILVDADPWGKVKKSIVAAIIAITYFAMGAAIFPILFFTLDFKKRNFSNNLHIYLCTIGLQLFIPTAYLITNQCNPVSRIMHERHKRVEILTLKLSGLACAAFSISLMGYNQPLDIFHSIHSYVGFLVGVLCCLDILLLLFKKFMTMLSLVTFITSSVCFCLGIFKASFQDWVPVSCMVGFTIMYTVFYSFMVVLDPLSGICFKRYY